MKVATDTNDWLSLCRIYKESELMMGEFIERALMQLKRQQGIIFYPIFPRLSKTFWNKRLIRQRIKRELYEMR